jgi:hypothetical protein
LFVEGSEVVIGIVLNNPKAACRAEDAELRGAGVAESREKEENEHCLS